MSLDPDDWSDWRAQGHRMLDAMFDLMADVRTRPLWQAMPTQLRAHFQQRLPRTPMPLAAVYDEFSQHVVPYTLGNLHPGFMGWVHGGGTAVGMLAELLAAALNANLGGRDHAPIEIERQVLHWMRELFEFPDNAGGLFVTGTSQANFMAVHIARVQALGGASNQHGLGQAGLRLTAYASSEVHHSVRKALAMAGLGSAALRLIAVDKDYRIDCAALAAAIAADRAQGLQPFLLIGTAGTVNTGALDDLTALADLAEREQLWLHVDGAFGALARLAPALAPRLAGIERADSLAFDFHKWGQVPYDAGFILVRDAAHQYQAFAERPDYLQTHVQGMAAGAPWPCDLGPDLSRGFRALKTWFTFKTYGADALAAVIQHSCALAHALAVRIQACPELELLAPVSLNIVCFRFCAADSDLDALNLAIVADLQSGGRVAPSSTRLQGRVALRAALVNHRTQLEDVDALIAATLYSAQRCLSAGKFL